MIYSSILEELPGFIIMSHLHLNVITTQFSNNTLNYYRSADNKGLLTIMDNCIIISGLNKLTFISFLYDNKYYYINFF